MFFICYQFPEIRDEVPEIFLNHLIFLTADGSARFGTGAGGGMGTRGGGRIAGTAQHFHQQLIGSARILNLDK